MKIGTITTNDKNNNIAMKTNNTTDNQDDSLDQVLKDNEENDAFNKTTAAQSSLALVHHYKTINMCRLACIKKEKGNSI